MLISIKRLLFLTGILSILFSCSNQGHKVKELNSNVIDVERALQNPTRLKTSDLGKTVRYIPLETTDDCLIGDNPIVKVLKDYIIVEYTGRSSSADHCLLFSKEDGRFIAEIGHAGQDPEAFTSSYSWIDEKEEFIYFKRLPNQLMKYDFEGNFCGKTVFSSSVSGYCYSITDSEIIGYFGGIHPSEQYALGFFDKDGSLKDTIPLLFPKISEDVNVVSASALSRAISYKLYGNWARVGLIRLNYSNDLQARIVSNVARLWNHNGNIRFKEDYVDTIYTISHNKLIPSITFHIGKDRLPIEERARQSNEEKIFIADVSENNDFIFFQPVKIVRDGSNGLYNGLFDKKTGETKLGEHSDGIEDDLTNFMPFNPLGMSTVGEFVSIVDAYEVMEWLEKHPEEQNNKKLSFLKELNEDMNPIVILIE